jgi:hypothetical protein
LGTYLASKPANTAATPYRVALNVNYLGGSVTTDGSLGTVLNNNNSKYVYLDLSGSTITSISENPFGDPWGGKCATLTGIIIPDSVTGIGEYAFGYCANLASVPIGNSVTTIWQDAFKNCTGLTSVTIPNMQISYLIPLYHIYGKLV